MEEDFWGQRAEGISTSREGEINRHYKGRRAEQKIDETKSLGWPEQGPSLGRRRNPFPLETRTKDLGIGSGTDEKGK